MIRFLRRLFSFGARAASSGDETGAEADRSVQHRGSDGPRCDDGDPWDPEAAAELPIDGELDLHHFHPREVRSLVPEYLRECRLRGIHEVRIVHGKGRGQLRRSVHALLARSPHVAHFALAPPERGGWGATLVDLHRGPVDD